MAMCMTCLTMQFRDAALFAIRSATRETALKRLTYVNFGLKMKGSTLHMSSTYRPSKRSWLTACMKGKS